MLTSGRLGRSAAGCICMHCCFCCARGKIVSWLRCSVLLHALGVLRRHEGACACIMPLPNVFQKATFYIPILRIPLIEGDKMQRINALLALTAYVLQYVPWQEGSEESTYATVDFWPAWFSRARCRSVAWQQFRCCPPLPNPCVRVVNCNAALCRELLCVVHCCNRALLLTGLLRRSTIRGHFQSLGHAAPAKGCAPLPTGTRPCRGCVLERRRRSSCCIMRPPRRWRGGRPRSAITS